MSGKGMLLSENMFNLPSCHVTGYRDTTFCIMLKLKPIFESMDARVNTRGDRTVPIQ